MRFINSLLEFAEFLGEIFQDQSSFSSAVDDAEKRKAVGHYLGGCGGCGQAVTHLCCKYAIITSCIANYLFRFTLYV